MERSQVASKKEQKDLVNEMIRFPEMLVIDENGNALGIFQGISVFINPIEYYEPLPGTWKKDLGVTSDKQTSINLAEDLYQIKLKDYLPKGKVDDIAEALLLAFYGLRQHFNKKEK